jgi:hypothetical protein
MSMMMPSASSNLKSKINAFNSANGKKEEPAPKPKVSSSISDRIKRLSTTEAPTELQAPTSKVSTTTTASNTPTSITIAGPKVAADTAAQKNGKVVEIESVYKKNNTSSQPARSSRFESGSTSNGDAGRASFFNRINDNIKKNSEKSVTNSDANTKIDTAKASASASNTVNSVSIKKDATNSNNFTITSQSASSMADSSDTASVKTITNSSLPRSNKFDENFGPSIDSSSSSTSTIDCSNIPSTNPRLAEEEDMSIMSSTLVLAPPVSQNRQNTKEGNFILKANKII